MHQSRGAQNTHDLFGLPYLLCVFRNHKSSMLTNKQTCELAVHFNCSKHEISEIIFILFILIGCYSPEKPIGPHNYAHLILMVLTKDANSDPKIASAIILN